MKIQSKTAIVFGMLSAAALTVAGSVGAATAGDVTASRTAPIATRMMHQHNRNHEAILSALKADDYAAFTAAIAGVQMPAGAPEITEAMFETLVQAEKLRESGDITGAKKILVDAGITLPFGHSSDRGKMPLLTDAQKATMKEARTLMHSGKVDEAKKLLLDAGIQPPLYKDFGHHYGGSMRHHWADGENQGVTLEKNNNAPTSTN